MKNKRRMLKWAFLLLGLVAYWIPQSVSAEQLNALGQLISKGGAVYIDNSPIPSGTTLLAGDQVRALNAPALISLTSGGRVELMPNTSLSVSGERQMLQISQTSGKARFYVPKDVTLTLVTPKATVKTVAATRAFSGVLSVETTHVSFSSESGEFAVTDTNSNKTTSVRDGESTAVPEESKTSSASQGSGVPAKAATGAAAGAGASGISAPVVVAVIAVAGAATAGLVAGIRSSNDDVKNNFVVSPSRP